MKKEYPPELVHTPPFSDNELIDEVKLPGFAKREKLQIKLKNDRSENMLFIMMNPSEANDEYMDSSVEGLIKFVTRPSIDVLKGTEEFIINDVGTLTINNLFSIYRKESPELHKDICNIVCKSGEHKLRELIASNNKTILNCIKDANYIVFAWGLAEPINHILYYSQIIKVLKMVKRYAKADLFVLNTNEREPLSKYGNPFHPIAKKLNGLHSCKINDFYQIVTERNSSNERG